MTESASVMVEKDNKLIFIVNLKAGKADVKRAVETMYEVKVKQSELAHYSPRLKKSVREANS
jgi:ribosomal protein L23